MRKSVIIVFEGISGCGKSNCIENFITELRACSKSYYLYKWNSNSFFRRLTDWFEKHGHLSATGFTIIQYISFLYDMMFKIIPAVQKYDYVLCDRYIYTGIVRDRCNHSKLQLFKKTYRMYHVPNIIFYIKADPKVCFERIKTRNKRFRFFTMGEELSSSIVSYLQECEKEYDNVLHGVASKVVKIDNTYSRYQSVAINMLR